MALCTAHNSGNDRARQMTRFTMRWPSQKNQTPNAPRQPRMPRLGPTCKLGHRTSESDTEISSPTHHTEATLRAHQPTRTTHPRKQAQRTPQPPHSGHTWGQPADSDTIPWESVSASAVPSRCAGMAGQTLVEAHEALKDDPSSGAGFPPVTAKEAHFRHP